MTSKQQPVRVDTIDDSANNDDKRSLRHLDNITGLSETQLNQEVEASFPKMKGKLLTYFLAFVAGTGFTLFG